MKDLLAQLVQGMPLSAEQAVDAFEQINPGSTNATGVDEALVDADGSESLSFVINLPAGFIPKDASGDPVGSFIGGGNWQVDAADIRSVIIDPIPDFAGVYTGLTVTAVTQEKDLDQASTSVPLNITINPVVTNTNDGLNWSPSVTVNEDNDIPLSALASGTS
ncbi:MAG: hypothetical protein AAF085_13600, partial [Planctomycetota bacterium]